MTRTRVRARSPEDQEQVRRRFVDCARKVFAEAGAHGLTMRRLAAEAGYSPGTIYLYFPSRQDLLREVWKEDIVALIDRFRQATAGGSAIEQVRALCQAWADFWFAQPDHFKVMFLEVDRQYVKERAAFAADESVQTLHSIFVTAVKAAIATGDLPGDRDPLVLTHSLLAAVHGVVALHIGNSGFPWSDRAQMIGTVLDSLLRGMKSA